MTPTAPRTISLENHTKQSPVLNEGRGRQVIGPEKHVQPW